ncbi:MAG: dihydroorotase [Eubacteriales bacterium]
MDVAVCDGHIVSISSSLPREGYEVFFLENCYLVPGFVDVHVHLREPGFNYKETVKSGTKAAVAGGYTTVFTMANLNPVPDSVEHLQVQLDAIKKDGIVEVIPYGAITVGEQGEVLADLEDMAPYVGGFSDDGRGVQDENMMKSAMFTAKKLGKPIVAHCEVNALLKKGGCIHDGEFAAQNGFVGISNESEWGQVKRDIDLIRETGCQYHVCHVSTKESVELVRQAKAEGLPVTCETGPHYLVMTDMDIKDEGRFKMNPPIRSKADQDALIAGLLDGTVDVIATDHAPHSAEEKSKGLVGSAFGIVGLETAFQILYTKLVQTGVFTLEFLIEKMAVRPREIFGLPQALTLGAPADFTVLDLSKTSTINPETFQSMGKSTPFTGWKVASQVVKTVKNGEIVYDWSETC